MLGKAPAKYLIRSSILRWLHIDIVLCEKAPRILKTELWENAENESSIGLGHTSTRRPSQVILGRLYTYP